MSGTDTDEMFPRRWDLREIERVVRIMAPDLDTLRSMVEAGEDLKGYIDAKAWHDLRTIEDLTHRPLDYEIWVDAYTSVMADVSSTTPSTRASGNQFRGGRCAEKKPLRPIKA